MAATSAPPAPRSPHVALLEDDAELRDEILAPGLRDAGFTVTSLGSAAALYRHLSERNFDLVVLDVGLPDQDGFTVARYLRQYATTGIVMLTGRGSVPDRVRGLSEGADAYLSKPVELELLVATLHSVDRRMRADAMPAPPPGWRLDANGWRLLAPNERSVELNQAERRVLGQLLAAQGEAVSREALIASLTPDVFDFDPHRLETLVHRLRNKVRAATGVKLPLRAVHGVGYVLAA